MAGRQQGESLDGESGLGMRSSSALIQAWRAFSLKSAKWHTRLSRGDSAGDSPGTEEDGIDELPRIRTQALLEVRLTVLFADEPGVDMADGAGPRPKRHAAVREVVILLDRRIGEAQRHGQPADGEPREIVGEKIRGRGRGKGEGRQREQPCGSHLVHR